MKLQITKQEKRFIHDEIMNCISSEKQGSEKRYPQESKYLDKKKCKYCCHLVIFIKLGIPNYPALNTYIDIDRYTSFYWFYLIICFSNINSLHYDYINILSSYFHRKQYEKKNFKKRTCTQVVPNLNHLSCKNFQISPVFLKI